MRKQNNLRLLAGCLLISGTASAQAPLSEMFRAPPDSAKPRVWWHWMNGNVSREGIRLDLEWMKRVGLGGVQQFDANLQTPQVVPERKVFMSGPWRDDFRFAANEAERLGLELAIASSGGWSLSGGPWVQPQQAMKKLVWSSTTVRGGQALTVALPAPPAVAGPFQDVPLALMSTHASAHAPAPFYRDTMVLAYPAPPATQTAEAALVSTSGGAIDTALLSDGDLATPVALAVAPAGEAGWIRFDYRAPRTMYAATVAYPAARGFGGAPLPEMVLQASDNGSDFEDVAAFALGKAPQQTVSFAARTARSWRLALRLQAPRLPPMAASVVLPAVGAMPATYPLTEFRLHDSARINRFEDKAGFDAAPEYHALPTPDAPASMTVRQADVIDLTGAMAADGTLSWTPPPGEWTVLRMGYGLTGHENGPASPEATGLEVDKLNAAHVENYLAHYLDLYQGAAGPDRFGQRGVRALLNDSIESGAQNWTEDMAAAFQRLRGYPLQRWTPTLTGQIVDSAAASDKFLWDFRRTIAQLLAENHYGTMAQAAKARGLTLYGEALEDRRPQLGDDLEMRKYATIPMGAMWTVPAGGKVKPSNVADLRGAASVSHVWGQNLVAAESMTAFGQPWAFAPRDLKATADLEFALGVNRLVIHTSAHQPQVDSKPGLALAPVLGQYFTRNETWAELAAPWVSYLSRNSLMLQQGRFVADIAYFYGEERPITGLYGDRENTDVPPGYAYDFVNQDALLNRLSVQGGQLATGDGMRYRVLYLGGDSQRMTLATLRRLDALVRAGATVVGSPPRDSPSLADDGAEFRRLVAQLWGDGRTTVKGQSGAHGKAHGKGTVLAGRTLARALAELGVAPDFSHQGSASLRYLHRRSDTHDIYFVSNPAAVEFRGTASFNISGRDVTFWNAEDGSIGPAAYRLEGKRTAVPLVLGPNESTLVVFGGAASAPARQLAVPTERVINGDGDGTGWNHGWTVAFEAGRGAPAAVMQMALGSWTAHALPGVRYFSGTGTYTKVVELDLDAIGCGRAVLDLGEVRDIAQVFVNGNEIGIGWKPPYRFEVGPALRQGANRIEVKVTNTWANRLVGDAQPGALAIAHTTGPTYTASAPLRPAGLIGPVRFSEMRVAAGCAG